VTKWEKRPFVKFVIKSKKEEERKNKRPVEEGHFAFTSFKINQRSNKEGEKRRVH
jgi:hypothetical protein